MSKLEELVPPLELCKLIPAGEFEDSALVWIEVEIPQENKKEWRVVNATKTILACHNPKHFAPTLQEIMTVFPDWSELSVDFVNPQITLKLKKGIIKAAPAEVLKLWLKMKGIEA